jgi:hypothetical protein
MIANRIAERWVEMAYPKVNLDPYVKRLRDGSYRNLFNDGYNKLPLKCKEILRGVTVYLCGDPFMTACVGQTGVLGFCRPKEKKICYNVQRFEEGDRLPEDFASLIYHEVAHYMVHHFTEKEKAFYFKLFGTEPVTSGEPEADGFVAYMKGLAPYKVNEFWSWWAVQGIN